MSVAHGRAWLQSVACQQKNNKYRIRRGLCAVFTHMVALKVGSFVVLLAELSSRSFVVDDSKARKVGDARRSLTPLLMAAHKLNSARGDL